jgi:hypothetical protein
MAIKISPGIAKIILGLNPFRTVMVMCRGYNDDDENFTELVWKDDKHLDFFDRIAYPEFQLWIR